MKLPSGPIDVSKELDDLKFPEKQNKTLPKLPGSATIHKRPINHAPITSPYAGSRVQKIVYVSRKTPVMSAVKRVKKFLLEIEKRALQSGGVHNGNLDHRNGQQELYRKLDQVSDKLQSDAEDVLVKASGRAMEQALRIGEWFRTREQEVMCNMVVRTGSVSVIDDIVEKNATTADDVDAGGTEQHATTVEMGDTTLELFQHLDREQAKLAHDDKDVRDTSGNDDGKHIENERDGGVSQLKEKRKRKRRRKEYDIDDVPEARIRWVKTVEVAISLRA